MFRPSARALITDPDDRILLLRVRDAVALNASDPVTNYWITVGGGVEPGETFEAAIVREIFEETGHVIRDPGPCILLRRKSVTDVAGVTRASDERYFWCPLSSAVLNHDNLTPYERTYIQEFRWWAGYLDLDASAYGDDHAERADLVAIAQDRAADRTGVEVDNEHTVLVGDTPNDVHAATTAGVRVIAVATGKSTTGDLASAGAPVVLPDLTGPARTVDRILNPPAAVQVQSVTPPR